jgi:hypothetical protein
MAKFKCLQTGNILEFKSAYDIGLLRKQTLDYEEVVEESPKQVKQESSTLSLTKKPA